MKIKMSQAALALAFALSLGIRLKAQEPQALMASKTGVIAFTDGDYRVDGTIINGFIQVRCIYKGAGHELVFRRVEQTAGGREYAGAEVARVKCKMERIEERARRTTAFAMPEPGGARKVTEILIRGESVRHVIG